MDTLQRPLAGFNQMRQCRHGVMLYNTNDVYIGRSLEVYGEFSEGEVELFAQIVRPGDIVVDAGANIGGLSIPLARMVGDRGFVFSFEPQPYTFHVLCANVALNSLTNVMVHRAALGEKPGEVTVPLLDPTLENNFGGLSMNGHTEGVPTPMVTLDSVSVGRCRMIKIDVEGMEVEVLRGGRQFIAKHRPILYVENLDCKYPRGVELISAIREYDYKLYWHRPYLYNPNNFAGKAENIFNDVASHNMFCLPAEMNTQIDGFPEVD